MNQPLPSWPPCPFGSIDDPACNGEYALLQALAPSLRMVVDVGANVGNWSAAVLQVAPGSRVLALEPQATLHPKLLARFANAPRFLALRLAAGEIPGPATLHCYGGQLSGMSSIPARNLSGLAAWTKEQHWTEPVEVARLDDLTDESVRVDLVKVDVEGFEMRTLRGSARLLASGSVARWQVEYGETWRDAGERLGDFSALMTAAGYALGTITPTGVVPGVGEDDGKYRNLFAWRQT